jgi:hypothetical protein
MHASEKVRIIILRNGEQPIFKAFDRMRWSKKAFRGTGQSGAIPRKLVELRTILRIPSVESPTREGL